MVLLPEMPFHPWLCHDLAPDSAAWQKAEEDHDRWLKRLDELEVAWVAASRPATRDRERVNQAFVWQAGQGSIPAHEKHYLPDKAGFYEATWYGRGDGRFDVATIGPARAGFLICSELWFFQWARAYGQAGAELLLSPRASTEKRAEMWLTGGRTAAFSAGAYCLSANRAGRAGPARMGGPGWIIAPNGEVLGLTSDEDPFLTLEIDLEAAQAAKKDYPLNVAD